MSTREAWLEKAIDLFRQGVFKHSQLKVPTVRVSVGWPYGSRGTKRIGEHWHPSASDDKKGAIFISPLLNDPLEALGCLAHELIHAAIQVPGHGVEFKRAALAIGLKGPMRSTSVGPEAKIEIEKILKILGPYPHSKLNPGQTSRKKQTTRLFKMTCRECGYTARSTRKHILYRGPLLCPCNELPMSLDAALEAGLEEEMNKIWK